MGKFFRKLKVQCGNRHWPLSIEADQLRVGVETILESWHDTGCWWEGESEKVFYRICCQDGGVREIFYDLSSREWFLYRIYD
ncbi:hypothetical protein ASZ90_017198 [hydrocarbon metagenome]|uniref:Uncharacterized protein n=1 Tax=hydrocarbon metagenome TaxID=938273 RepID=A0A0W8EA73_9ZZZZ